MPNVRLVAVLLQCLASGTVAAELLPPGAYAAGVARIAEALDLPEQPGFFTEELRHHGPVDDADLPADLAALHDRLRGLAGDLG